MRCSGDVQIRNPGKPSAVSVRQGSAPWPAETDSLDGPSLNTAESVDQKNVSQQFVKNAEYPVSLSTVDCEVYCRIHPAPKDAWYSPCSSYSLVVTRPFEECGLRGVPVHRPLDLAVVPNGPPRVRIGEVSVGSDEGFLSGASVGGGLQRVRKTKGVRSVRRRGRPSGATCRCCRRTQRSRRFEPPRRQAHQHSVT